MMRPSSDYRQILVIEESSRIVHELEKMDEDMVVVGKRPVDLQSQSDIIEGADWSVVIVDMEQRPDLGAETVKTTRMNNPGIPVLLITDRYDQEEVVTSLGLPNISIIRRPYKSVTLNEKILRVICAAEQEERGVPGIDNVVRVSFELEYRTDEIGPWHLAGFIAGLLRGSGFCDDDTANRIETAVNEAIVNAIEHGNLELDSCLKSESLEKPDRFSYLKNLRMSDETFGSRKIFVRFLFEGNRLAVTIADEGKGFDHKSFMANLHTKTEPENLMECHGRGLLMARYSMDEIFFNEIGNEITMVKYLESFPNYRSSENPAAT